MGSAGGPLAGLRVVEIAALGPVPHAAMVLAELGAEVVRIDRPDGGGLLGALPTGLNRSRPSVAVDLKHPEGADAVLRLLDGADVLIEGLRPGVMERLGLGPEVALARNPRLVYARMTGWGQEGPLASRAGHDITYAAVSGALHLAGGPDRPRPPANLLADFGGGSMLVLVGVLAALVSRGATGNGQVVDAAMVDGAALNSALVHGLLAAGLWQEERGASVLDGGAPFYDTYACADGRFVAVGALEPEFHAELFGRLGLDPPSMPWDPSTWPRQRAQLSAAFAERTRDEWAEVFTDSDACVAPVLTPREAPAHAHLRARGTFTGGAAPAPRVAPRFSATPAREPGPARATGADTTAYLLAHGFGTDEVRDLLERRVLHQGPE